jgi:uncharacterized YccA/Bax inhibitor family protein
LKKDLQALLIGMVLGVVLILPSWLRIETVNWGPIIGTAIAIVAILFAVFLGYIIGHSDAKEGK